VEAEFIVDCDVTGARRASVWWTWLVRTAIFLDWIAKSSCQPSRRTLNSMKFCRGKSASRRPQECATSAFRSLQCWLLCIVCLVSFMWF